MTQLNEVRVTAGGIEICTALDSNGYEKWESYVNVYVRVRRLEWPIGADVDSSYSIAEHLEEVGWIPPDRTFLEDDLCLAKPIAAKSDKLFHGRQCLLRKGHIGSHRNNGLAWEEADTKKWKP